jgi:nuclear GTP-binding protein
MQRCSLLVSPYWVSGDQGSCRCYVPVELNQCSTFYEYFHRLDRTLYILLSPFPLFEPTDTGIMQARYIQHLSKLYPTIAFHASPTHSFGKGTLIQLLRQFSQLHADKKQISVGLIGYPNVGKSSVINTLKSSKVCKVAPIPGETKVWQYITLTRRIYLIDCPGIVPSSAKDSNTATVLKGVVRVEALPQPSEHIDALLERVKPVYIARTYGIPLPASYTPDGPCPWEAEELLDKLARMKGRLLKGGEPDLEGVSKMVLNDWVRGKLPFFVAPPERPEDIGHTRDLENLSNKEGTKELKTVPQKLGGIIQKNKFEGDDVRILEDDGEVEESEGDSENSSDDSDAAIVEEDEDEQGPITTAEVGWDDVFGAVVGLDMKSEAALEAKPRAEITRRHAKGEKSQALKLGQTLTKSDLYCYITTAEEEYTDDDDSNPRKKQKKDARMTTNKKKTENFFTKANVKNRNRERVLPKSGGRSRERPHSTTKSAPRKRR